MQHHAQQHVEEVNETGYHRVLSHSQIQMIAIGGAIGVGLFLGIARPLTAASPALIISYLVVATLVYLLMRACGEVVLADPRVGSFVTWGVKYVHRAWGAYTGWIYVSIAILAATAEVTAIAVYWSRWFPDHPHWLVSLLALGVIIGTNLASARVFGWLEFGAAAIKVTTIILFLITGLVIVFFGAMFGFTSRASVTNLWAVGGFAPNGWLPVLLVIQGVVFSFSAVEIVAITAGEAKDPVKSIPRAVQNVMIRVGLFYIVSIIMLAMLLPWNEYSTKESPFVTALASLNIPGLAEIMNFVVITAAISGVNATVYATVRLLQSLAVHGLGPKAVDLVDRRGVPTPSLVSVGLVVAVIVLLLNFAGGAEAAFGLILGAVAGFILFGWISILVSHAGYRRRVDKRLLPEVPFRLPGGRVTSLLVAGIFVAMFLWMSTDTGTIAWIGTVAVLIYGGLLYLWFSRRHPDGTKTLPF